MKSFDYFKKPKPSPRDYLYIDETRLDSYIEQISSTSTFRISPSLKFGITKLSGELNAQLREKTNHEKVCELIEYLEHNDHISHNRPGSIQDCAGGAKTPDYVLEECDAFRILIPSKNDPGGTAGIGIWVSEWPLMRKEELFRPPGILCLIQDSTHEDKKDTAGFSHSGYTWLQALLYQLSQEKLQTELSTIYPLSPIGDYLYDISGIQRSLDNEMQVIRQDPLSWLKEKGCRVLSTQKRIVALYRIRNLGIDQIGNEYKEEDFTVSTFAYAIAIWAGSHQVHSGET